MDKERFYKKLNDINNEISNSFPYTHRYTLSVKEINNKTSLLSFYSNKFNRFPAAYWKNKIDSGEILVNGKVQSSDYLLKSGELTERIERIDSEPFVNKDIDIIHLDDEFVVLNKPAPLPTQASGRFIKNTLQFILSLVFLEKEIYPIHRLDANTTGILVFAFSKKTASALNKQIKNEVFIKKYVAIVEGLVTRNQELTLEISNQKMNSGSRELGCGKGAITQIAVKQLNINTTLLEIILKTGRTNQIRLHLSGIGHPILGDKGYKDPTYFLENPMTYTKDSLYLHAWKLSFLHPITNAQMSFEAPIPEKFFLD